MNEAAIREMETQTAMCQCHATNHRGDRCKRLHEPYTTLCWQHAQRRCDYCHKRLNRMTLFYRVQMVRPSPGTEDEETVGIGVFCVTCWKRKHGRQ
jgi:hypothetical protein